MRTVQIIPRVAIIFDDTSFDGFRYTAQTANNDNASAITLTLTDILLMIKTNTSGFRLHYVVLGNLPPEMNVCVL